MEQIFNWIGDKLSYIINVVLLLLPESPFVMMSKSEEIQQYLGYVNWVIPVGEMVAVLQVWLPAVLIFYTYQVILRLGKAIE